MVNQGWVEELSTDDGQRFLSSFSQYREEVVFRGEVLVLKVLMGVDEENGCLGTRARDQARLEDAWPAEAPRADDQSVGQCAPQRAVFGMRSVIWIGDGVRKPR